MSILCFFLLYTSCFQQQWLIHPTVMRYRRMAYMTPKIALKITQRILIIIYLTLTQHLSIWYPCIIIYLTLTQHFTPLVHLYYYCERIRFECADKYIARHVKSVFLLFYELCFQQQWLIHPTVMKYQRSLKVSCDACIKLFKVCSSCEIEIEHRFFTAGITYLKQASTVCMDESNTKPVFTTRCKRVHCATSMPRFVHVYSLHSLQSSSLAKGYDPLLSSPPLID